MMKGYDKFDLFALTVAIFGIVFGCTAIYLLGTTL